MVLLVLNWLGFGFNNTQLKTAQLILLLSLKNKNGTMCKVLQTGYVVDTTKKNNNYYNDRNVEKISNKRVRELKVSFNTSHQRPLCRVWQVHARDISRKLKENGAKNGSARARSRRVLPYSANWIRGY